jgi:uncharacterized repeat protein (TIGR03803 family)
MNTGQRVLIFRVTLLLALAILSVQNSAAQAAAYSTIYNFQGGTDGESPHAGLTLGKDGKLFGTTYTGGTGGYGTVFELASVVALGPYNDMVLGNFNNNGNLGIATSSNQIALGNGDGLFNRR